MTDRFFAKSGPPELILHILERCESFQDATSLALTCRHMANIWLSNDTAARIVWQFWLRDLPCADESLIAVSWCMAAPL